MLLRCGTANCIIAVLLMRASGAIQAADVLRNVPPDALGFAVVRNLDRFDADIERLIQNVQFQFPGPLAFLQASTGIRDGLDRQGDFLLAVLPGEKASDRPHFAVWLPVSDYDQFLATLEGAGSDRITAVTLAGEDLLVAEHADWALLMDPNRRTQMEAILAAAGTIQARATPRGWQSWIDGNGVTAVLLPSGIRAIWMWALENQPGAEFDALFGDQADGLFELSTEDGRADRSTDDERSADDAISVARRAIQSAVKGMPELTALVRGAAAVACGVRLDEAGNATGGFRVAWQRNVLPNMEDWTRPSADTVVPVLRNDGEFIVVGGGAFPSSAIIAASAGYAHYLLKSMESENRDRLRKRDKERFIEAMKHAAGELMSAAVLTLPGEKPEGVYTNRFAAVRVKSAADFADRANEVVRLWNEMNHDVQGELRLVFDSEPIEIAGRKATEHSIDMTAAVGTPGVPEIREAMEKLFGSEGKLRILIVPVDDQTVLVAGATREQAASALKLLSPDESPRWDADSTSEANGMLSEDSAWRVFFSPHGYNRWRKRQTDAVVGPVIGGPLVRDFPVSPAVGASGGFGERELWFDVAVPVETVKGAAMHLKK